MDDNDFDGQPDTGLTVDFGSLSKQQKDLHLFNKWKETKKKEDFQQLYRHFGGLINEASKKASMGSNLPRAAFKLEAAQQFYDALERFNPDKGASLQTHLYGSVENKLKRLNYTYQNLARRPERAVGGVYHITQFNNERLFLQDKLGREPSAQEIADNLGWSVKQVETMMLEDRRDLSLNAELEEMNVTDTFSADEELIAMHYYDMNPEQQLVFDYATGRHGKQAILRPNGTADFRAIAQKLNMAESKVQKLRNQIIRMVKRT